MHCAFERLFPIPYINAKALVLHVVVARSVLSGSAATPPPPPVNARPAAQYAAPSLNTRGDLADLQAPVLPLRSPAAVGSYQDQAAPETPTRASAYSSASYTSQAPQTPPRTTATYSSSSSSSVGVGGYKRAGDISPSSVFSSGRPRFNVAANKDICPRCAKQIYHAEKAVGPRGPWHKACFKCRRCNTLLSSTTVTEHDGEAFCRNCYTKLFSPRGYNIGGSTESVPDDGFTRSRGTSCSTDRSLPQSPVRSSRAASNAAPPLPPASPPSTSPPRQYTYSSRGSFDAGSRSIPGAALGTYTTSTITSASAAAATAAAAAVSSSVGPPSPIQTAPRPGSSRSGLYGRAYQPKKMVTSVPADICPRCNDRIYAAESGMAAGRKYHKKCIRCRLCNTAINSLQLTERDGDIFCRQCYAKHFGPKGFRPTLGSAINDY
ncbi:hypothetical protein FBU59_002194 [Linderina macrospora]|uniref:Uncharacterized protein n=1 Tax=Linderina macrospora TaxID=4868 RepID=A0ACC1JC42_9FUNG|nr:hypothetical protein FBU59_002194 [Linderina macrospora]